MEMKGFNRFWQVLNDEPVVPLKGETLLLCGA
jgi:hypothetical protein